MKSRIAEVRSQKIRNGSPKILLLPGSRKSELQRHLPVMLGALKMIQEKLPSAKAKMVLPNQTLLQLAKSLGANVEIQIGELPWALAEADVAIASTGTVTMECAFFGVPTVTLYKTSWLTYEIAKRIVTVKSLTMPNLLAGETFIPNSSSTTRRRKIFRARRWNCCRTNRAGRKSNRSSPKSFPRSANPARRDARQRRF